MKEKQDKSSNDPMVEPYFILDLEDVRKTMDSVCNDIQKACSEIKKEVMVRWGGDCNFEDPIEDIQSSISKLKNIFEVENNLQYFEPVFQKSNNDKNQIECKSKEGLTIGLIDSIGYIANSMDINKAPFTKEVQEALVDLGDNEYFIALNLLIESSRNLKEINHK